MPRDEHALSPGCDLRPRFRSFPSFVDPAPPNSGPPEKSAPTDPRHSTPHPEFPAWNLRVSAMPGGGDKAQPGRAGACDLRAQKPADRGALAQTLPATALSSERWLQRQPANIPTEAR